MVKARVKQEIRSLGPTGSSQKTLEPKVPGEGNPGLKRTGGKGKATVEQSLGPPRAALTLVLSVLSRLKS